MPELLGSLEQTSAGSPRRYGGTLSIASGNTVSIPILIQTDVRSVSCGVRIVGQNSKGRIEYTLSPINEISEGNAFWMSWPDGDVAVSTDNLLMGPVTALRAVCTAGAIGFEFVGA